ncbi:MAG: hypothetical protein WAZ27_05050 [Minisyncoccia bacterium]
MVTEHSGATRHDVVMAVANMPKADVALYIQMCWACLDAEKNAEESKVTKVELDNMGEFSCAVMRGNLELH